MHVHRILRHHHDLLHRLLIDIMSLVLVEPAAAVLAEQLVYLVLELLLDVLVACAFGLLRPQEAFMLHRGPLLQSKNGKRVPHDVCCQPASSDCCSGWSRSSG